MGITSPFGHLNVRDVVGDSSSTLSSLPSTSTSNTQGATSRRRNHQDQPEPDQSGGKKQRKDNSFGLLQQC